MGQIIGNLIIQLLYSVGIVVFFAVLIHFVSRLFYKLIGRFGRRVEMITGFVGTPIHEIGHAIMCVIFLHKIVDIKLFSVDLNSGTLGYVKHNYNRKNIYHLIGNFFIGIGPILFGALILLLLMWLLIPSTLHSLNEIAARSKDFAFDAFSAQTYKELFLIIRDILATFFSVKNLANPFYWIYIIICSSIALHMRISPADIRTSVSGFGVLLVIWIIVDVVLFFVGRGLLTAFTDYTVKFSFYIINFLLVSVFMSIVLVVIALIVFLVSQIAGGRRRYRRY